MMVGLLEDVTKSCVIPFRKRGDKVLLLGTTLNEIGCSEYGHYCHQQTNRLVPDINFELEKRTCELVRALMNTENLNSCHDVSSGGIAVTLAECCLGGERPIGASLHLEDTLLPQEDRADAMLFSESSGRFLISCTPEAEEEIRAKALEYKVPITASGEVGGKDITFSERPPYHCRSPQPLESGNGALTDYLVCLLRQASGRLALPSA